MGMSGCRTFPEQSKVAQERQCWYVRETARGPADWVGVGRLSEEKPRGSVRGSTSVTPQTRHPSSGVCDLLPERPVQNFNPKEESA